MNTPAPKDLPWVSFLAILALLGLCALFLLPAPGRGAGDAGIAPSDCIGRLLAAFALGVVALVAGQALRDRARHGRVATPRRHVAIASVLAAVALFLLWPAACTP